MACPRCEYLAAMLAAYDGAALGKDRQYQKQRWLEAADKAIAEGWHDTVNHVSDPPSNHKEAP